MAEFRTLYYGPMDREYHQAISEAPINGAIEDPIFPISELGETVPEHDPAGRFKNIIQTTQAAIRGGAGTLQIVLQTPPESAIGGRPKAYGKEVREALKEVVLASEVNLAGVEMPTSLNNMAGFDYQQMVFSDEKRKTNLDEVRDAIKFVADVGRGGGVDIVSWEFPRGINEAPWQEKDPLSKDKFEQVGEQRIGWLVDDRTGRTIQFRKDEVQHIPYDKENFEFKEEITKEMWGRREKLPLEAFEWTDFVNWAKRNKEKNARNAVDPETGKPKNDRPTNPEEIYVEVQLTGQITSLEGWRSHYLDKAEHDKSEIESAQKIMELAQEEGDKELIVKAETDLKKAQAKYHDSIRSAYGQEQQAGELKERIKHLKPMEEYAIGRSARTYAEAGVTAMKEYEHGKAKGTVTKPLYVGPELGWPTYFGSHPAEFVDLIKKSRNEMAKLLTEKRMTVPDPIKGERLVDNPYYDPNISKERAKELAKTHVKGLFDTSHMGMWLAHFKPEKDPKTGVLETEEVRIKRFNKWYKQQVEKIAKEDVVGGIQLVDSMSAAHGHLPPGQGIFPVKEAARIFRDKGYSGFLVSEGHEEEKFGEGRIRMKTWQMAGAPVGAGYFSGPPLQWQQVAQNYFGRGYSPLFMFGSYAPSNEFKLWSEIPFE